MSTVGAGCLVRGLVCLYTCRFDSFTCSFEAFTCNSGWCNGTWFQGFYHESARYSDILGAYIYVYNMYMIYMKKPFIHETTVPPWKNRSFTNIHVNIHTSLKINRSTPKYVLIFEICGNFHVSTLTGMYCWIPVLLQSYWYCFVSTFATDIFHAQLYHQCIIPSFVGPIKC